MMSYLRYIFTITELHRTRIVEQGFITSTLILPPNDEIVRIAETILSTSRGKRCSAANISPSQRKANKSRGKIGFGNLARTIANAWKVIDPKHKAIFDHYAEVDTMRYKRELKVWKDKKGLEDEARAVAKHADFLNRMNNSSSSVAAASWSPSRNFFEGSPSYHDPEIATNFELADERSINSEPWNISFGAGGGAGGGDGGGSRASLTDDLNASCNTLDSYRSSHEPSEIGFNVEQESMQQLINRQQQILENLRIGIPANPSHHSQASTPGAASGVPSGFNAMVYHQPGTMQPYFGGNQHMNIQMGMMGMHQQQQPMRFQRFHQQVPSQATMGFYNWNSTAGNSSLNSLQTSSESIESSLFSPSNHDRTSLSNSANQISDYSGSQYSNSSAMNKSWTGFNSSFSSAATGFHNSVSTSTTGEDHSQKTSPSKGGESSDNEDIDEGDGKITQTESEAASSTIHSLAAELKELQILHSQGALTDKEFEQAKAKAIAK